ncbi:MAG: hypothetical protein AAB263_11680 [Planctomycetota bacterium]
MDNDLIDLADRLCTVVGIIMEDNNLLAISTAKHVDDRTDQLIALAIAGEDIAKLIAAAKVLIRLS